MSSTGRIQIRVSEDVLARIQAAADEDRRSLSSFVLTAVLEKIGDQPQQVHARTPVKEVSEKLQPKPAVGDASFSLLRQEPEQKPAERNISQILEEVDALGMSEPPPADWPLHYTRSVDRRVWDVKARRWVLGLLGEDC